MEATKLHQRGNVKNDVLILDENEQKEKKQEDR